jgi:hypothetical protein
MGTTLYLATDPPLKGVELNNDRVFLAKIVGDYKPLEALCEKLGVRSLADFQSYDPKMLGAFIEDEAILQEMMAKAPPIQWFDPKEALAAVRALRSHYAAAGFTRQRSRRVSGKVELEQEDRTGDLLVEFDDLEMVLAEVAKAGARFRIYIGE